MLMRELVTRRRGRGRRPAPGSGPGLTTHVLEPGRPSWQLPTVRAPTSSTPASCSPTRSPCCASTSTRSSCPVVVITELEGKRAHPELGYFARQALRLLDDLRVRHGRLDAPLPVGEVGGTVRVELNHTDPSILPPGFRLGDNDTRILAVARNLAAEGADVTLVSKDLPMRVKASAVGLTAEEYRGKGVVESGWTGMAEIVGARGVRRRAVRHRARRPAPRPASCPATPGWCWSPSAAARWAG